MTGFRTIGEWPVLRKPITIGIAVAYTHCPRKAFVLLHPASCDAMVRINHDSSPNGDSYSPQAFSGRYAVTDDD
jgi:hypothetical protein